MWPHYFSIGFRYKKDIRNNSFQLKKEKWFHLCIPFTSLFHAWLFCTCRVHHVPVIALRAGGTKAKKALFKLLELKGVMSEMMNESSFHISAVWHERLSTTTKQWVGHRDHELPAKKRITVSIWRLSRLHAHPRPSMNEFCVLDHIFVFLFPLF